MTEFDPNSWNAVTARILAELKNAADNDYVYRADVKETLAKILEQATKTNGRVTNLERDKWFQRGFVAAITLGISIAWHWYTKG